MENQLPLVSVLCRLDAAEGTLPRFHGELFRVLRSLEHTYQFEIHYLVQDGKHAKNLRELAQLDPRICDIPLDNPPPGGDPMRPALRSARGEMIICLDAAHHSPEIIVPLLDRSPAECAIVATESAAPAGQRWLARWRGNGQLDAPSAYLFKRAAIDAIRAIPPSEQSLFQVAQTIDLPRVRIPMAPSGPHEPVPASGPSRVANSVRAARTGGVFHLSTYSGATIFLVGLLLAIWFSLQGLVAPDRVWFSWCYLIVLLHILGGSILFTVGKLGTLAQRLLDQFAGHAVASQPQEVNRAAPIQIAALRTSMPEVPSRQRLAEPALR